MSIFRHILFATDFSETASKAMSFAQRLAIESNADLILVHAFDVPATWSLAAQVQPRNPEVQVSLNALLAESPHRDRIKRFLHAGPAGEVICWMAQEHECDLIIVGTHGRSGLRHLLFGSVAEYVLRHARCPVMAIRDRDPDEPPLKQPLVMPIPAPRFM